MKNKVSLILAVVLVLAIGFSTIAADPKYKDGAYIGVSDFSRGYTLAVVMIKDGVVSSVMLTEMNDKGIAKDETYSWAAYHEAMKVLPDQFVQANDFDIDVFTGATSSSKKAMKAVERALDKALVDRPEGGKYFDGVFFGKSKVGDRGYGTAVVTIEDDVITEVELFEITGDGEFKDWETYPWEAVVKGRLEMQEAFVEANSPEVDIITEATGSSTKWIEAVEDALKSAAR